MSPPASLFVKLTENIPSMGLLLLVERHTGAVITQPIDQIKTKLGSTATFAWLIGGALLFVVDGGVGHLFTLQALLFLGVGMFVAAFLVGLLSYKIFLRLADRAALAAGAEGPRGAVLRAVTQSQMISATVSLLFVGWCYVSFFKEF